MSPSLCVLPMSDKGSLVEAIAGAIQHTDFDYSSSHRRKPAWESRRCGRQFAGVVAKREIHPNETMVVKSVMTTMQILSKRRRVNSRMMYERFMTLDV